MFINDDYLNAIFLNFYFYFSKFYYFKCYKLWYWYSRDHYSLLGILLDAVLSVILFKFIYFKFFIKQELYLLIILIYKITHLE
jgi:hypothetical protein